MRALHAAALDAGLAEARDALLRGLPEPYKASIPQQRSLSDQLFQDLHHLNETEPFEDGLDPLVQWLDNAMHLAEARRAAAPVQVFKQARIARAGADRPPSPLPPPVVYSSRDYPALPSPPRFQYRFVGRDAELTRLAGALLPAGSAALEVGAAPAGPRLAAVLGIGGMGKTALAQELAVRHDSDFPGGVLWGDFGSEGSSRAVLDSELSRWEESLYRGRSQRPERGLRVRLEALKSELSERARERGPCLAILDNVDTKETLEPLLEVLSSCAVLITTRKRELVLKDKIVVVELLGLSPEEGAEYLRKVLNLVPGAKYFEVACRALDELGYHPLSMRLITGALRAKSVLDPLQLLQRIIEPGRPRRRESTGRTGEGRALSTHVPDSNEDCFAGAIQQLPPEARVFLSAVASLPPSSWTAEQADHVSGIKNAGRTLARIEQLYEVGLLHRDGDGRYGLHRVLRRYVRESSRGLFAFLPRTWEVCWLATVLARVAPGVSAGEAVYGLRQEQWSLGFAREHRDDPAALRRESGSIVLGLRRRAERGFGAAAARRLDDLRGVLRWADLSGLRLETAVLNRADLSGAHLRGVDLSGEPIRPFPRGHLRRMLRDAAKATFVSAAALALSILYYRYKSEGWDEGKWSELLLFLPVAFIGATDSITAIVLRIPVFQKLLERRPMRLRYMVERGVDVLLFVTWGLLLTGCAQALFHVPEVMLNFAKMAISLAVPFLITSWLMFRLARWAGRMEMGGLFVRFLFAVCLASFILASCAVGAAFFATKVGPMLIVYSLPMAVFAAICGLFLSPERPLLTSLRASYLREANLRDADLSEARLDHVQLAEADLENADLTGASLAGADLRGAQLKGASLRGADLAGADLSEADLEDADLSGADLRGARIMSANLKGVRYSERTRWPSDVVAAGGEAAVVAPSYAE